MSKLSYLLFLVSTNVMAQETYYPKPLISLPTLTVIANIIFGLLSIYGWYQFFTEKDKKNKIGKFIQASIATIVLLTWKFLLSSAGLL